MVSLLLIILFFIVFVSGVGLHFAPSGRIARDVDWSFFGFSRDSLEMLHTLFGYLMSGLVVIHLFLNYKMFFNELRVLFKR